MNRDSGYPFPGKGRISGSAQGIPPPEGLPWRKTRLCQGIAVTLTLKLQNGTVKEYPFRSKEPTHTMKCGAMECDHVECILEERRASRLSMKTILVSAPIGTVFILGILLFYLGEALPSERILVIGAIVLMLLLDLVIMFFIYRIYRDLDRDLRELQEFSRKKTVNGLPAEQIPGAAGRQ
jgi:hypothetical protein